MAISLFFRFEVYYPLWIVPFLVFILYSLYKIWIQRNKTKAANLGSLVMLRGAIRNTKKRQVFISFLFMLGAVICLCLAIANPQRGQMQSEAKVMASDIFLAIDISESMNARDVPSSRMERAKAIAEEIAISRRGDRIAIILFAGSAYLQMPLTTDIGAIITSIRSISTDMAGTQGTDIAAALDIAIQNTKDKSPTSRAVIIISDGEDHINGATISAKSARKRQMLVSTIAVGTIEGDRIPTLFGGREEYKRDDQGKVINSQVNIEMLNDIAKAGGGKLYSYHDGQKLISELNANLIHLSKEVQQVKSISQAQPYYWIFAILALICILTQIYHLRPNHLY
jgi:Ca-activated chloride channel family protein